MFSLQTSRNCYAKNNQVLSSFCATNFTDKPDVVSHLAPKGCKSYKLTATLSIVYIRHLGLPSPDKFQNCYSVSTLTTCSNGHVSIIVVRVLFGP